ncbi:redoxin domain-containing protein [Hymenobacter sp. HMF4947]|uniref:Redoxin domain-containing protein n=1 Tax=Hymenobacter ginkgonis TaxID=2682976 RepID=A0A7K1TCI7_9BACT|nr:redoxin family protein [Hymenobacter ginkgonis]MVN75891.1 redoxin domain-containing protein [Hymenobacter ginkgonis]
MTLRFTYIFTWVLGCFSALSVAAQPAAPRPAATTGIAVLTGHIANSTTDTIAVSIHDSPFDLKERISYAHINEKGDFKLTVQVNGSTKADLVYGDAVADLFLDPGTDIDLKFKGDDMPGTIKFKPNDVPTGFTTRLRNGGNLTDEQKHRQQMANANSYLAEFDEQFVSNDGFQVLPDNIQLYEAPFISFIDYRLKHEQNFLEDRAAKQSFTIDFYNYAKAEIKYSNANDRLTFVDLREQVVNTEGRLTMSPTYYDYLRDPNLINDQTAVQNEQFQEFLLNYIHYMAAQQKHLRTDPDFYPICYSLASKRLNGASRLLTLGRILQESFRFGHVRQSAAMLADYRGLDTKKFYLNALESDFNKHKALAIGAPAPDFKLLSATGDTVKLSSFQGKLVYLNFWKSTNGLCLRDLPYAQDLNKRFEGKNIVFINVALDELEVPWRQLVVVKKLPGVHVRAIGGMRSDVAKAYNLSEVPTYVLLGEDGTILNAKPKRLSSRAAVDEINQSFGKASMYTTAMSQMPTTTSTAK